MSEISIRTSDDLVSISFEVDGEEVEMTMSFDEALAMSVVIQEKVRAFLEGDGVEGAVIIEREKETVMN